MDLQKLNVHEDDRGLFVETYHLPHDGQVSYLVAPAHETRGNHYHERKTEYFTVIHGSAEFQVRDRATNNVMKVTTSGSNPMVVRIAPNNTHNITASAEGCICLIWCDEQYDVDDPDTFEEEI